MELEKAVGIHIHTNFLPPWSQPENVHKAALAAIEAAKVTVKNREVVISSVVIPSINKELIKHIV